LLGKPYKADQVNTDSTVVGLKPAMDPACQFSPRLASGKIFVLSTWAGGSEENRGGLIVERDDRGHWLPGRSANPGGRPGVPDVIKATLRELSPRAVKRLGELLDSDDERIQLEAAKAILDRHLGKPAIQADLMVRGGVSADHLEALLEVARKRRAEPIDLDERDVRDITPCLSGPK
jgi:hypothetical protein